MGESIFNLTRTLGHQSISLLSFLDDKLYALGERVEACFNSVFNVASAPVLPVLRQALLGCSSADVSSDCEEPPCRKTDTLLHLVNLLVYTVSYVSGVASVWLFQHSQAEDKHQLQATQDDEDHSYVKSKLPAEDHHDNEPELGDTAQDFVKEKVHGDLKDQDFVKDKFIDDPDLKDQDFVKEKVMDDGDLKEQQQHDEPDEVTKLFDASWSLGTL